MASGRDRCETRTKPPESYMRDATVSAPLRRELAAVFVGSVVGGGSRRFGSTGSSGCERGAAPEPLCRCTRGDRAHSSRRTQPPARAARVCAARGRATPGCPKDKMGPTRGVEDKAADILALARSLVHENDATLGRSKSTLRKTMRKTQTQHAVTTSPTSKLRTTRWKSRTMQQLANGRTLCGNQNLRRVRAESTRRPPRHRRDACSMAWRCRFLTARPSQDGRVIAEK